MSHGKTTALLLDAIKHAVAKPNSSIAYLCPAKEEARAFLWRQLLGMLADEDIQADVTHRRIDFPNGSAIRLIREDEERKAHGLVFDKITGEPAGPFWRSRLRQ